MTVTKHLARNHFREERFISVLVLRVQSPARKGMAARARGSLLTSQKAREQRAVLEMWQAINLNIHLHLLPAVGLYLRKVSQPPKTTWPSGDKVFKHINLEELFISRTQYSLSSILQTTSKITLKYKSDYGSVLRKISPDHLLNLKSRLLIMACESLWPHAWSFPHFNLSLPPLPH